MDEVFLCACAGYSRCGRDAIAIAGIADEEEAPPSAWPLRIVFIFGCLLVPLAWAISAHYRVRSAQSPTPLAVTDLDLARSQVAKAKARAQRSA